VLEGSREAHAAAKVEAGQGARERWQGAKLRVAIEAEHCELGEVRQRRQAAQPVVMQGEVFYTLQPREGTRQRQQLVCAPSFCGPTKVQDLKLLQAIAEAFRKADQPTAGEVEVRDAVETEARPPPEVVGQRDGAAGDAQIAQQQRGWERRARQPFGRTFGPGLAVGTR
jgi:hypothetical protein